LGEMAIQIKTRPMKYSIQIDTENEIIRYKHSGIILATDIEEAWNDFLKLPEFTEKGYNLLSDYRNGRFSIMVDELSFIMEYMVAIECVIREKKQALIVDDPYSVAASMIFEKEVFNKTGFLIKVFCTEESAFRWLLHKS